MECRICFENVAEDSIVSLECAHSLCQTCLGNLRQPLCPFCRTSIKDLSTTAQPLRDHLPSISRIEAYDLVTTIRRRRRRRYRNPSIPHTIRVPSLIDPFDIDEIQVEQQLPVSQVSVPDKERQRRRNNRNRWRQNSTRNIIGVESR